ncbi:MAG: LamG domain-containing protein [Planctomycetota bacterium]
MRRLVICVAALLGAIVALAGSSVAQTDGNCLAFDDDGVQVPDSPSLDLPDSFTLEGWVYLWDYTSQWDCSSIIDKNGAGGETPAANCNYRLAISPDGRSNLWYEEYNGANHAATSDTRVPLRRWVHVAGVWDGSFIKLFHDGVPVCTPVPASARANTQDQRVGIGYNPNENPKFLLGLLDEVRVWSLPRSQAEIYDTMFRELSGSEPGLVLNLRFNEGLGQTAFDTSIYGNHGQLGSTPGEDADDPQRYQLCRIGNVNLANRERANVLFVNGTAGDEDRVVAIAPTDPLLITVNAPPTGPFPALFVLDLSYSVTTPAHTVYYPNIGYVCFPVIPPFLFVGYAPLTLADLPGGLGFPVTLTLQGLMEDHGSPNGPDHFSVTNAIVLDIR